MIKEFQIEENLIEQLKELKYAHRPDITNRKSLEQNFKDKFEALNRVRLTDSEFLLATALKSFVEKIMSRMIFDGEKLTDLLAPLELGWKERKTKELALMEDLVPPLKKLAQGREISGLAAYE